VSGRWAGAAAALAWVLLCVRWFDVAAPWCPAGLRLVPPVLLAAALAASLVALLRRHGRTIVALPPGGSWRDAGLMVALAVLFRLPMAWTGAVGYTTPDGSLSGLVALRIKEGVERLVFVPSVPYSGSLKSHLAATFALVIDLSRAFTLSSVLFYALFVAGVYAFAAATDPRRARTAALYAIFSPAFVTRYSLSNDGNYVEVLGLGTVALFLAARSHSAATATRNVLAWAAGVALGFAFWSHILAVIPALAAGATFAFVSMRILPRLAGGFALGAFPSLLWNAANGGETFLYLMPGGQSVGTLESGPGLAGRALGIVGDQWPVLMGYDPGYAPALDGALWIASWIAAAAAAYAYIVAARRFAAGRDDARGVLLLFSAVNIAIALTALPYIAGNARYLLFLAAPIAVFVSDAWGEGDRRWVLGALIAFGALGSLGQWPSAARSDARWRAFVGDLERAGVSHCYTDFYLAAKIDLVSEERVVCASDLGPSMTEYFKDYPARVAKAQRPALIAVNPTAADKLERRFQRIGVRYRRLDLMKPVLIPERHVHPSELFPRGE
jgi:hypothetical protein